MDNDKQELLDKINELEDKVNKIMKQTEQNYKDLRKEILETLQKFGEEFILLCKKLEQEQVSKKNKRIEIIKLFKSE